MIQNILNKLNIRVFSIQLKQ